LLPAKREI